MRHNYSGRKLKRTASHRRALLANLATSLFEHKRLVTTVAKAKELRPFAEQLITRAKHAYSAEKNGSVKGVDVHNRRMVGRFIRNKAVLQELFDTIAPLVIDRSGGYTRITKLGLRRGDSSPEAMIELVDWSNPQDGRVTTRTRKQKVAGTPKTSRTASRKVLASSAIPTEVTEEIIREEPLEMSEETSQEISVETSEDLSEESSDETSESEKKED